MITEDIMVVKNVEWKTILMWAEGRKGLWEKEWKENSELDTRDDRKIEGRRENCKQICK